MPSSNQQQREVEHAIQLVGQLISLARGNEVPSPMLLVEAEKVLETLQRIHGGYSK
jgi:hypothetical protein